MGRSDHESGSDKVSLQESEGARRKQNSNELEDKGATHASRWTLSPLTNAIQCFDHTRAVQLGVTFAWIDYPFKLHDTSAAIITHPWALNECRKYDFATAILQYSCFEVPVAKISPPVECHNDRVVTQVKHDHVGMVDAGSCRHEWMPYS